MIDILIIKKIMMTIMNIFNLIYSMPWKFVCDLRFHEVLQTKIIEHSPNYIRLGSPQTHKGN